MSKKKSAKKRGFKKIKKDGSRVEVDRRRRRRTRPNKRKPRKGGPKKVAARTNTKEKPKAAKKPIRKKEHRSLWIGEETHSAPAQPKKKREPRRLKKAKKRLVRRATAVHERPRMGDGLGRGARGSFIGDPPVEVTDAGHHPGGVEDPYFDRRSDDELARDAGYRDAEHMVQAVNEFQEELDAAEAMNDGGVGEKYTHAEGPDPEQPDAEFVGELEDIDIL